VRITFLITNAYGGGDTIRTTLTMAAALAARHDVEVVSVLRHRDEPMLPIDPRVRLRALVDNRPHIAARRRGSRNPVRQTKGLMHSALSRIPSRLAHRQDVRYRVFSARSDLALIRFMRTLSGGVVVGTRPSLNLILARHTPPGVIAVGQEHLHLARHSRHLRDSFVEHYPRLDALTTLTEGDAADYRELLGADARVDVVPHAVPDLGGVRATHDPATKVIVAAGRLTRQNGFDRLISAFALVSRLHPGWRLEIYGVGRIEEELRATIDAEGLADVVRLAGFAPDLHQRFGESAIFVLSSRSAGFPMVLLEAMGCGLPLVGFDGPTGPADLVRDGCNGLLVTDGNVPELAQAICRLIDDPLLRLRMGTAGAELALEYAADRIAVRWERLFEELSLSPRRRSDGRTSGRRRHPA
jgi:glycosyltransferase involved in cell wall biosynthesis